MEHAQREAGRVRDEVKEEMLRVLKAALRFFNGKQEWTKTKTSSIQHKGHLAFFSGYISCIN